MPAHKICPHCQHAALSGATACALCGHPFQPADPGPARSSFGAMPPAYAPQAQTQPGQSMPPEQQPFLPGQQQFPYASQQVLPPGQQPYPGQQMPYSGQTPYSNQQPPYPGQMPYPPPYAGQPPYQQYPPYAPYGQPYPVVQVEQKSKVAAAALAFFLGGWGIHGFYTGNTAMGATLLAITLVSLPLVFLFGLGLLGLFAVHLICIVQAVLYLSTNDYEFHQKYVAEKRWF